MRHRSRRAVLAAGVALALAASGCGGDSDRVEDVARRGGEVMPFDLDATLHVFWKRDFGGVQRVVAQDPDDDANVQAIRRHLREEARRFARGDYSDPAIIHGDEMPGMAELSAGYERIEITYRHIAGGAAISYRSAETHLVRALHAWFDAQVTDHGEHATEEI